MSIKFKVLPKKNPQDITAPEKFYATSVANGETTLESLADTDCYAVLRSLERNKLMELSQSSASAPVSTPEKSGSAPGLCWLI